MNENKQCIVSFRKLYFEIKPKNATLLHHEKFSLIPHNLEIVFKKT